MAGALLATGCHRGAESAVVIEPGSTTPDANDVPVEPFSAPTPAYAELRDVTDAALALPWNGTLESFAPWLEEETAAVERALALLKALRASAGDEYAVANARIALVYERIASALTDASATAEAVGYEADWKDQQGVIREQANGFWARCVRLCGLAGAQLDAWDLRCRRGLTEGQRRSPRQPK